MSKATIPEPGEDADEIRCNVKKYYGKHLSSGADLQTDVCSLKQMKKPKNVQQALSLVHEDIKNKYFGCGLIAPEALEGCAILDLGSGAGMDVFVLSKLVGENGHVTGLDMTDEQLAVARSYIGYHTEKFGFSEPNVDFVQGYLEKMPASGLKKNSFDVIVSNCVINLCPDKKIVLADAFDLLKDGGELYFSTMFCDKEVSDDIRNDDVFWDEGIGGAVLWRDLYQMASDIGYSTPRLMEAHGFRYKNSSWIEILTGYNFASAKFRLFKLPENSNDYKPVSATYLGGIDGHEMTFDLDCSNVFQKDQATVVPGDVAAILKNTRFQRFFKLENTSSGLF